MQRKANTGFTTPLLGLGCVDLNESNNDIIDYALQHQCTFFDTADCYGNGASEIALGKKLQGYNRQNYLIATKVGLTFVDGMPIPKGDKEHLNQAIQNSLDRLQTPYIDLLYLHRVDPQTPIEESILTLKSWVEANKVKYIGLSEVTANQIRRAHKIHPISAVQIEYSPMSLQDETNEVIATCKELGITVVAYSPLGRGLFSETPDNFFKALPANDYRNTLPRYKGHELLINLKNKEPLQQFAHQKGCGLSTLVLAWEIYKGHVPIPATINKKHFDENQKALQLHLTEDDYQTISRLISATHYAGPRYLNEKFSAIYPDTFFAKPQLNSVSEEPAKRIGFMK